MALIGLFVLFLLFRNGATFPTLCNNQKFDDHRYLYGQVSVSCSVFRNGTCLIVSPEKVDISIAQMECTYKYGGQLVVPKNMKEIKTIIKKLHYHHSVPADYAESKFFLGLIGNTDYDDLRVNASMYSNTLEKKFWDSVMMSTTDDRIKPSEYPFANGHMQHLFQVKGKANQPPVGTCVDKMIVLNPNTAEFEVVDGKEKHYYLCETPRWPKYKCPEGYLLDRSQPMCYKAYSGKWNFKQARIKCRQDKSVIAASRHVKLVDHVYEVFLTYLLNEDTSIPIGQFHTGILNNGAYTFCDDGASSCIYGCANMQQNGFAFHYVTKTGVRDDPYQKDSFCRSGNNGNEILDSELGVICSVRPDQTE
uniref:C-type lectin domain-containing protein n=1 Tax=Panagrellus redivivus TaxID=6233 RepID=A0A7E4VFS5_PANRE